MSSQYGADKPQESLTTMGMVHPLNSRFSVTMICRRPGPLPSNRYFGCSDAYSITSRNQPLRRQSAELAHLAVDDGRHVLLADSAAAAPNEGAVFDAVKPH